MNNDMNNSNNSNDNHIEKKVFHFDNSALTMTLLPRNLGLQVFWFPKYTLYLHRELICYHRQNKLDNFGFVLINNGSVSNCNFIEKGILRS